MSPIPSETSGRFPWKRSLLTGAVIGTLFGVLFRLVAGSHFYSSYSGSMLMTVAFLVLGPFYIGFVTLQVAEEVGNRSVAVWIFAPWVPVLLSALISACLLLEGAICIVFALPITLLFSSFGGVLAGLISRSDRRLSNSTLSCLALVPLLLAPAESLLPSPVLIRTVSSQIRIHAPVPTIWRNIERVPTISPAELRTSWAQRIGFPRPVEATLSYEGVGGIRHATFERGLTFIETVTAWEPEHRLAFGIKADTAHIPPTTLDEHVTIGGRYFDILDGEYRVEPLANGDVLLHLTSHQRLSTDFNGYAGFWSDAVMQNLQTSILEVIRHRCEHA
ncbi:MAG TPA: hypothetical protein VNY78_07455 [Edaphobacter sp.]|jgi:hypothetical protein|nr:hypothetical protein [Edaphobacter sp.]